MVLGSGPGRALGAARVLAPGKARVPGLVMARAMASALVRVTALAPAQARAARWVLVPVRAALAAGCCPGSRHRRRRRR
jgi:hypothetical protein